MAFFHPESVIALAGSAATAIVFRHRRNLQVTVIAKATFAWAPDADMPRVEPQAIVRSEVHHGKNPTRSVRLTTDLAPYLAQADIVFTGHAHAPVGAAGGATVDAQAGNGGQVLPRVLPVRLAVFDRERARLDKTLTVQDSSGLQSIPLTYERAFGGLGFVENPFGTGAEVGSAAPNVIDPADPRRPASFAPLGRAFPGRKRLLGGTERRQLEGDIAEIPDDFDWGYFQAAPKDQRTEALTGGEWLAMEGLHPTLPRLRTRLPNARGLARVHGLSQFGVAEGQLLELVADTLRIDGDEQRCTVVWRRSFPIQGEAALAGMRIVAGVEVMGSPLRWEEANGELSLNGNGEASCASPLNRNRIAGGASPPNGSGLAAAVGGAPFAGTMVVPPEQPPAQAILPFQGHSSALALQRSTREASGGAKGRREMPFSGTLAQEPEAEGRAAVRIVLPFSGKPQLAPLHVPPAEASPPAIVRPVAPVEAPDASMAPAMVVPPAATMARPQPPAPEPPAPSPPEPPAKAAPPTVSGSPWAPSPPPEPSAPRPKPVRIPPAIPTVSPTLKRGLYGRFGK